MSRQVDASDLTVLSMEDLEYLKGRYKITQEVFQDELNRRAAEALGTEPPPPGAGPDAVPASVPVEPEQAPEGSAAPEGGSAEPQGTPDAPSASQDDEVPPWNKSMTKPELREVLVARGYEVVPADSEDFKSITHDALVEYLQKDDEERAGDGGQE